MTEPSPNRPSAALANAGATAAAAVTMLVLDIGWLGLVARGFYDSSLGPLRRPEVFLPAAALFYAMYIGAVVVHAVIGASSLASALRRGAALGFVTYATYDLTNWAVLNGWPALLVPVDIAWGVALTAAVAGAGKLAQTRILQRLR